MDAPLKLSDLYAKDLNSLANQLCEHDEWHRIGLEFQTTHDFVITVDFLKARLHRDATEAELCGRLINDLVERDITIDEFVTVLLQLGLEVCAKKLREYGSKQQIREKAINKFLILEPNLFEILKTILTKRDFYQIRTFNNLCELWLYRFSMDYHITVLLLPLGNVRITSFIVQLLRYATDILCIVPDTRSKIAKIINAVSHFFSTNSKFNQLTDVNDQKLERDVGSEFTIIRNAIDELPHAVDHAVLLYSSSAALNDEQSISSWLAKPLQPQSESIFVRFKFESQSRQMEAKDKIKLYTEWTVETIEITCAIPPTGKGGSLGCIEIYVFGPSILAPLILIKQEEIRKRFKESKDLTLLSIKHVGVSDVKQAMSRPENAVFLEDLRKIYLDMINHNSPETVERGLDVTFQRNKVPILRPLQDMKLSELSARALSDLADELSVTENWPLIGQLFETTHGFVITEHDLSTMWPNVKQADEKCRHLLQILAERGITAEELADALKEKPELPEISQRLKNLLFKTKDNAVNATSNNTNNYQTTTFTKISSGIAIPVQSEGLIGALLNCCHTICISDLIITPKLGDLKVTDDIFVHADEGAEIRLNNIEVAVKRSSSAATLTLERFDMQTKSIRLHSLSSANTTDLNDQAARVLSGALLASFTPVIFRHLPAETNIQYIGTATIRQVLFQLEGKFQYFDTSIQFKHGSHITLDDVHVNHTVEATLSTDLRINDGTINPANSGHLKLADIALSLENMKLYVNHGTVNVHSLAPFNINFDGTAILSTNGVSINLKQGRLNIMQFEATETSSGTTSIQFYVTVQLHQSISLELTNGFKLAVDKFQSHVNVGAASQIRSMQARLSIDKAHLLALLKDEIERRLVGTRLYGEFNHGTGLNEKKWADVIILPGVTADLSWFGNSPNSIDAQITAKIGGEHMTFVANRGLFDWPLEWESDGQREMGSASISLQCTLTANPGPNASIGVETTVKSLILPNFKIFTDTVSALIAKFGPCFRVPDAHVPLPDFGATIRLPFMQGLSITSALFVPSLKGNAVEMDVNLSLPPDVRPTLRLPKTFSNTSEQKLLDYFQVVPNNAQVIVHQILPGVNRQFNLDIDTNKPALVVTDRFNNIILPLDTTSSGDSTTNNLLAYARYQRQLNYDNENSPLRDQVDFVLYVSSIQTPFEQWRQVRHMGDAFVGEYARFGVKSTSSLKLYFAIIGFDENGAIEQFYPRESAPSEPLQSDALQIVPFNSAFGPASIITTIPRPVGATVIQTFKLYVTTVPMTFKSIEQAGYSEDREIPPRSTDLIFESRDWVCKTIYCSLKYQE